MTFWLSREKCFTRAARHHHRLCEVVSTLKTFHWNFCAKVKCLCEREKAATTSLQFWNFAHQREREREWEIGSRTSWTSCEIFTNDYEPLRNENNTSRESGLSWSYTINRVHVQALTVWNLCAFPGISRIFLYFLFCKVQDCCKLLSIRHISSSQETLQQCRIAIEIDE